MKITVGSEETRLLDKACKCFSRNLAQMNDLNGMTSKRKKLEFSALGQWQIRHMTAFATGKKLNIFSRNFNTIENWCYLFSL